MGFFGGKKKPEKTSKKTNKKGGKKGKKGEGEEGDDLLSDRAKLIRVSAVFLAKPDVEKE